MYEYEVIYNNELNYIYGYSFADACKRRNIPETEVIFLSKEYID